MAEEAQPENLEKHLAEISAKLNAILGLLLAIARAHKVQKE